MAASRPKGQKPQKQHALKAQKPQKQHALKGQKLLAQGIALGIIAISKAPCKGKSFMFFAWSFKAFALTGRQVCVRNYPGRCPGLGASALSGRAASRGLCPLPLLYPSASDFQFPSAGDRWFRAYWVISTVQGDIFSLFRNTTDRHRYRTAICIILYSF